jgi:hypothetical protein
MTNGSRLSIAHDLARRGATRRTIVREAGITADLCNRLFQFIGRDKPEPISPDAARAAEAFLMRAV